MGFARTYCGACGPAPAPAGRNRALANLVIYLLCGLALVGVASDGQGEIDLGVAIGAIVLLPAALLATLIHEIGHAVAGRAAGATLLSLTMGSGQIVWRRLRGGFAFELGANPLGGGRVSAYQAPGEFSRWRAVILFLGGAAANAVCAAALFLLVKSIGEDSHQLVAEALGIAATTQTIGVANVLPFRLGHGPTARRSDGLRILNLLRSRETLAQAEAGSRLLHGAWLIRTGRAEEASVLCREWWESAPAATSLLTLGLGAMADAQGPRAAVAYYLAHRARLPDAPPHDPALAWLHAVVAWQAARAAEPEWVGLAADLSARAQAALPCEPHIGAIRGAALLCTGETQVGLALLRRSLPRFATRSDKAEFLTFLADRAEARGLPGEAAEYRALLARAG